MNADLIEATLASTGTSEFLKDLLQSVQGHSKVSKPDFSRFIVGKLNYPCYNASIHELYVELQMGAPRPCASLEQMTKMKNTVREKLLVNSFAPKFWKKFSL